jgi:small subunit ribosomal protein S12
MATLYQRIKEPAQRKKDNARTRILQKCPQARGFVNRLTIVTPRKPNSAKRPVVKVLLKRKGRLTAHIPGIGHTLKKFSKVLVRGRGPRDLPGVRYALIRGVLDFIGLKKKKRRRSIYGAEQNNLSKIRARRKYRVAIRKAENERIFKNTHEKLIAKESIVTINTTILIKKIALKSNISFFKKDTGYIFYKDFFFFLTKVRIFDINFTIFKLLFNFINFVNFYKKFYILFCVCFFKNYVFYKNNNFLTFFNFIQMYVNKRHNFFFFEIVSFKQIIIKHYYHFMFYNSFNFCFLKKNVYFTKSTIFYRPLKRQLSFIAIRKILFLFLKKKYFSIVKKRGFKKFFKKTVDSNILNSRKIIRKLKLSNLYYISHKGYFSKMLKTSLKFKKTKQTKKIKIKLLKSDKKQFDFLKRKKSSKVIHNEKAKLSYL